MWLPWLMALHWPLLLWWRLLLLWWRLLLLLLLLPLLVRDVLWRLSLLGGFIQAAVECFVRSLDEIPGAWRDARLRLWVRQLLPRVLFVVAAQRR